jgi:hypothetical protein
MAVFLAAHSAHLSPVLADALLAASLFFFSALSGASAARCFQFHDQGVSADVYTAIGNPSKDLARDTVAEKLGSR